jgi:transposase
MDQIHLLCPPLESGTFAQALAIDNRTEAIRGTLQQIRDRAGEEFPRLRIVVEPTGVYHQLLTRIARELGYRTALVNAEHVVKTRTVLFGDSGKTDQRDPHAIAAVADGGRLIVDRVLPEVYQVLRGWSSLYQIAEEALIEAKGRVHRALKYLFPDFDFSTDFLYSASGQAIMKCYRFDPQRLAVGSPSRVLDRLRRHCRILRSSVHRLLAQARSSATSTPEGPCHEIALEHLRQAWVDYTTHFERREAARAELEQLYESARRDDRRLPAPVHRVVTACGLARLFAELGPLSDFQSWRQVLKFAGLNLRERKSGRYVGLTKITHKGRPQLRRVAMQLVLPLVRRQELFGAYYAQKSAVQKMAGPQAMTAVARKFLKMIWGWSRSAAAFDAARVFNAAHTQQQVA